MKKLSFFLMAMLVSLTSFAAALGEGYEKVTNISSLSTGDKVVLYCDASSIGVTGWNNSSDAIVAATGFVEYTVTVVSGGVTLKDESAGKYIAKPTGNHFKYNATAGTCSTNGDGVLTCNSRYLCYNSNNGNYYRMYTAIGSYKPFYVYKVVATIAPGEPNISVSAGSIGFGAVPVTDLESVTPQTLTVEGENMSDKITVALSDQNFTISVTELPAEGGDITIAPATNLEPDTYETTLTLTSGTTTKTVTLTIDVKDVYTITWNALGVTTTTTVVQGSKLVLPEDPTCDYKTFVGWATSEEVNADGSDITFVNDLTIPTASATYYAVFAVMSQDETVEKTGTYTISSYTAGTQYAKNEEHKLDDDVTIYTTLCHFTTELRIYSSSTNNGYVVSNELPGAIKSMSFNAGNKSDNLVVFGSTDGEEWEEVGKIATQTDYDDYTLSFGDNEYTYFKLDVEGENQIRIKSFSITYLTATYTDYSTTCVAPVVNHTITVSANPAEGGVVTGTGEYEETDEITVKAVANDGYEFVNWTEDEVEVSTDAEYTFEVLADRALVANFEKAAPATETVYFVNALNWTGTINAYAWDPTTNADWPGVAATKEAEQIAGYDVYSYTAEAGAYKNIIFNGTGGQTADLVWTAGKYYVKDGWYTKEEAAAKLEQPIEYESVYFVNVQGWSKVNIYTWTPEVGGWPGVAMTKEDDQLSGYDVYSYTVEKGTAFGGMLFNNADGVQTGDLVWTAGKYYVKDGWYTKEEAIEKLAGPVTPPVISYVLMGVAGDWTTGIALTANPDNANEYVLLDQTISEGDAVKVVTLTDGVATAWCGNVDEYSVEHSADDMGNIVLAPGKYDFYYKVTEDIIYIGGEAYKETITWELNGGKLPTATVPTQDSLIAAFKDGYNAYFGVSVATTRAIDNFLYAGAAVNDPTCDVSLFMKDDASPWKWLGDYVLAVTNAQIEAGTLSTLKELATELMWRQSLTGFFLQQAKLDSNYKGNADFTEAGKPEAWGAAYQAAHAVVLPTEPVEEDYVLPTPTKEGYTFVGWYDNAEGTGKAMTVLPAGWAGTLYAIWEVEGPATALENIAVEGKAVKAIVNGQLIIIKNGVQYNAQGAVVK